MVSADPIYTVPCHRSWVFHFGLTVVLISGGMISLIFIFFFFSNLQAYERSRPISGRFHLRGDYLLPDPQQATEYPALHNALAQLLHSQEGSFNWPCELIFEWRTVKGANCSHVLLNKKYL